MAVIDPPAITLSESWISTSTIAHRLLRLLTAALLTLALLARLQPAQAAPSAGDACVTSGLLPGVETLVDTTLTCVAVPEADRTVG
jgi:hypothetical protein